MDNWFEELSGCSKVSGLLFRTLCSASCSDDQMWINLFPGNNFNDGVEKEIKITKESSFHSPSFLLSNLASVNRAGMAPNNLSCSNDNRLMAGVNTSQISKAS